ncbi:MAG: UPF0158 family protein [Candidatus Methylumidiphilus sp.]
MMHKLPIDRGGLILALRSDLSSHEAAYYLDTETGALILFTEECREHPEYGIPEDMEVNPRYLEIIPFRSHETFKIMEDFIDALEPGGIADHLIQTLSGKKPFRRFKDALYEYSDLPEQWFQFEDLALTQMAEAWCRGNGIEFQWIGDA